MIPFARPRAKPLGAAAFARAMLARHRLRDGREVVLREAAESDAAALLENIHLVSAEHVYILTERIPNDLDSEREWLRGFDGVRSVLSVAQADGGVVGQASADRGGAA